MNKSEKLQEALQNPGIFLLAAVLSGGLGNVGGGLLKDPRPDPWTGTQERQENDKLEVTLNAIRAEQAALRTDVALLKQRIEFHERQSASTSREYLDGDRFGFSPGGPDDLQPPLSILKGK